MTALFLDLGIAKSTRIPGFPLDGLPPLEPGGTLRGAFAEALGIYALICITFSFACSTFAFATSCYCMIMIWFCAACSASARATPDDALPARMLTPSPMSSLAIVTAVSGSPASSR